MVKTTHQDPPKKINHNPKTQSKFHQTEQINPTEKHIFSNSNRNNFLVQNIKNIRAKQQHRCSANSFFIIMRIFVVYYYYIENLLNIRYYK